MLSKTITNRLSALLLLSSALLTVKVIASEQVPTGQLPENVEPTHYQLTLKIDPEQERFSGQTSIDLKIKSATNYFYLNGKELTIKSVSLKSSKGKMFKATAKDTTVEGVMKVTAETKLAAGKYTITFDYDAPTNKISLPPFCSYI